ncbi:hypothetical protein DSO57_1038461 [Entomophthora muscae]|uniref:Uncharacterized protein n=1 Tax=Entomophthora muscae TaxID=34485 RepID=A0ACC2S0U2_9FUNG|nr:hypothetical protein DSO57_1038461 [Entomophthora muscae]
METIYREGTKITIPPLLFCNKYNYLPVYLVPMTPPLTPQPNCPQEYVAANESTSTQIFKVITNLVWALPAGPADCLPASSQKNPQAGSLTTPLKVYPNPSCHQPPHSYAEAAAKRVDISHESQNKAKCNKVVEPSPTQAPSPLKHGNWLQTLSTDTAPVVSISDTL